MDEQLSARISELRTAAEVLQHSTASIRASVGVIRHEIAALSTQVNPHVSPTFGHLVYSGRMVELCDTLERLSYQLVRAADDVDYAARWHGPPLGVLWDRINSPARIESAPAEIAAGLAAYTLGSYISRANRPLYDALLADRDALNMERANVQQLTAERAETSAEYDALRDRLRAYGETNLAAVPRVQVLERQISAYDRDIREAEGRIQTLETRIESAAERLIAVNPSDHADVHVIRELEGGESAPYVLANTRDCVNYIASRVAIPGELAANAHLWDERASEYPQFGIRVGDAPLAGAILVLETDHPYADDRYGHVMLVERVDSDGDVWVTDNNHAAPVRFSDLTTETSGPRIKYLYLPWNTRA